MSVTVIHRGQYKARKEYYDDGRYIIESLKDLVGVGLTFSEWKTLLEWKKNRYRIQKGQVYERQYNKQDGTIYTWRCLKGVYDILCKYELFPEY